MGTEFFLDSRLHISSILVVQVDVVKPVTSEKSYELKAKFTSCLEIHKKNYLPKIR